MATETLTATLQANDRLSGALREVASSARVAARGLDSVDNKLIDIAEASSVAQEGLEEVSSELTDLIGSGGASQTALDQVSDELGEIRNNTATSAAALRGMSDSLAIVAGAAIAGSEGLDELGKEASDATSDMIGLIAANIQEAVSAGAAGSASQAASEGIDEMGDEAREAAGSMFAASGAADALSLSSSALSINVGAFTIALRNLTTQIPVLVTSLGGLVTVLTGVASAAILAAGGVSAVLAGGFLAEAENLSGSLEDTENTMEAIQAIGGEIKDMMIEAIQPLLDAEGIVDRFRSSMETLAATVQMFSGSIAAAFSNAEEEFFTIAEFMDIVGGAWLDNLESITRGFMTMWHNIGPIFTDVLVDMMEQFEAFSLFVSEITMDLVRVFGSAGDGIKQFVGELIQLGVNIASGIAPVMSMFLELVGDVASAFNSFEDGTVGAAMKVLVLAFALNKVAGAMGAIISPLTGTIGALAQATKNAGSFTDALLNTVGGFGRFLKAHVGGFAALSKAMSVIVPTQIGFIDNMQKAAASTDKNVTPLRSMVGALWSMVPALGMSRQGFNDMAVAVGSASLERVTSRLGRLKETLIAVGVVAVQSMRKKVAGAFNTATTSIADGLQSASMRILDFANIVRGSSGLGDFASKLGGSVMDRLSALKTSLGRGLVNAAFQANLSLFALGGKMGELDRKGGALIGGSLSRMGGALVKVKDAAIQAAFSFGSLFTSGFIAMMSAYESLLFGMFDGIFKVGGAARNAASQMLFFGEALRAVTTGGVTDRFRENMADMFDIDLSASGRVIRDQAGDLLSGAEFDGIMPRKKRFRTLFSRRISEGFNAAMPDIRSNLPSLGDIGGKIMGGLDNALGGAAEKIFNVSTALRGMSASSIRAAISNRLLNSTMVTSIRQTNILTGLRKGLASITTGLSGAMITLTGAEVGATAAETALNVVTAILTGSFSLLAGVVGVVTGALSSLAVVTGALVGVLGIVVVVGGAVVAMLAALGQGGRDAETLIQGLVTRLKEIASTVMPVFLESAEMILDVLDALLRPVNALIGGFRNIAVALGLMEESAGGASGFEQFINILESGVAVLAPFLDQVGRFAQLLSSQLTVELEKAMEWLQQFLVQMEAGDKIRSYIAMIQRLASQIMGLKDDVMDFVNTIVSSFMGVLENSMSRIGSIMDTFRDAFGIGQGGGEDGGIFETLISVLEGFYSTAISFVGPVLELLGSLFEALMGTLNVAIGIIAGLIKIIIRLVAAGMDLTNWLLGLIGLDLGSIFDGMVEGAQLLVDAIMWVIKALTTVLDVGMMVGNAVVKAFSMVYEVIKGLLTGQGITDAARSAAEAFGNAFADAWNATLGGVGIEIPEISIGGGSIAGQDIPEATIGGQSLTIPEINAGSSGSSGGGRGGGGGGVSAPASNEISMDDVTGGAQVAKDVAGEGAQRAGLSVPGGPGVEYNEGDVQNNYQQNISADPEDKGTLSRVVKDAMEEANSFERRQQGGQ